MYLNSEIQEAADIPNTPLIEAEDCFVESLGNTTEESGKSSYSDSNMKLQNSTIPTEVSKVQMPDLSLAEMYSQSFQEQIEYMCMDETPYISRFNHVQPGVPLRLPFKELTPQQPEIILGVKSGSQQQELQTPVKVDSQEISQIYDKASQTRMSSCNKENYTDESSYECSENLGCQKQDSPWVCNIMVACSRTPQYFYTTPISQRRCGRSLSGGKRLRGGIQLGKVVEESVGEKELDYADLKFVPQELPILVDRQFKQIVYKEDIVQKKDQLAIEWEKYKREIEADLMEFEEKKNNRVDDSRNKAQAITIIKRELAQLFQKQDKIPLNST